MGISPEFSQRREKFFSKLDDNSIAILTSNDIGIMSNDVDYYYRQNSDLYYLSGFVEPKTVLVFEKNEGETKYTMIVPPKDPEFETWNGRRSGVEGAKENFGADESYSNENLEEVISEKLPKYGKVYYEIGRSDKMDNIILNLITKAYKKKRSKTLGPHILVNPTSIIEKMRTKKTPYELELMRRANKISIEAHRKAMKSTKVGMKEYELEAVYMYHFYKNGARRPAYTSIVGSGVNATILHYIENDDTINDGDLVLADCGSEFKYYASDITRTWPANGKFTDPQTEVYQIVLDVQNECIEMCKPGIKFKEIADYSVKKLTEGMVKLGLLEGDVDKLIEDKKYRRFYMHGLGHWLGIDTHDTSRISLMESTLEPGHVFTIEPGIYIPEDDDIEEKYRGIGVRIEDDILITENGHENLTGSLEKTVDELEKLLA